MRNQRRFRPLILALALILLTTLYVTSSARRTRESAFYTKTSDALAAKYNNAGKAADPIAQLADGSKRAEARHQREEMEKGRQQVLAANNEETQKPTMLKGKSKDAGKSNKDKFVEVHGESELVNDREQEKGTKSVAGRIMVSPASAASSPLVDGVAKVGNTQATMAAKPEGYGAGPESKEDHEVEVELNGILKKSPIIIFSKTFCPFSKKAKRILLDEYKITPAPYVVELDEHPMGAALQAALASMTGRRTVPNILISGKSIGGGDDVENLHINDKIIDTVKSMGGKRIMEARLVSATKDEMKKEKRRRR